MGDGQERRKEIEARLQDERDGLEAEIERRQDEAKRSLDEMLSEKDMEFCDRCGKVVRSRTGWGGKCVWGSCDNRICRECWEIGRSRFCKKHAEGVDDEKSDKPQKRHSFGIEDDEPEMKVDLKAVLDEHDDSRRQKVRYFASEYARMIAKRMEEAGPIDWTPRGYLKGATFSMESEDGVHTITVSTKRWFMKKPRLAVVVVPYDAKAEDDANSMNAEVHKTARRQKGYVLLALVSDGASMEAMHFVNRFSDPGFCLYLAEPKNGHLNYNIKDPVACAYSEWFSQRKEPRRFRERLMAMGELVSGRRVVSAADAAKEFGFPEKDAEDILRSCGFLTHVRGTDTYMVKEE